jgi:hypothetical protein
MFRRFAFCVAVVVVLGAFSAHASAHAGPVPKHVTISQLLKRMSRADLIMLLGKATLVDSTFVPSPHGIYGVLQLKFVPVAFEGVPAVVTAMVMEDTIFTVSVSIPRRGKATIDEFTLLRTSIAAEIGELTAYTDTYIDYMMKPSVGAGGMQTVFGSFKDGLIKIDIIPKIGP